MELSHCTPAIPALIAALKLSCWYNNSRVLQSHRQYWEMVLEVGGWTNSSLHFQWNICEVLKGMWDSCGVKPLQKFAVTGYPKAHLEGIEKLWSINQHVSYHICSWRSFGIRQSTLWMFQIWHIHVKRILLSKVRNCFTHKQTWHLDSKSNVEHFSLCPQIVWAIDIVFDVALYSLYCF
jgi:hypothetical protein